MWNMTILTIRITHYIPSFKFLFWAESLLTQWFTNYFRLAEALCTYIEQDRPFLGICLGLQLLFESSEENGPGSYLTLLLLFQAYVLY